MNYATHKHSKTYVQDKYELIGSPFMSADLEHGQ